MAELIVVDIPVANSLSFKIKMRRCKQTEECDSDNQL
jgi:hypothetical protein